MLQSTWSTENYSTLSTIWADFIEGKTSKQRNILLYLVKGRQNAQTKLENHVLDALM